MQVERVADSYHPEFVVCGRPLRSRCYSEGGLDGLRRAYGLG